MNQNPTHILVVVFCRYTVPNFHSASKVLVFFASMQALDSLVKEDMKHDKQQRLEQRKRRLSEMLLKETKKYEVI